MNRKNLFYDGINHIYNFQQFHTIRSFAKNSFNHKITLFDANEYEADSLVEITNFSKKTKPKRCDKKKQKEDTLESAYPLFEVTERVYDGFISKIFPLAPIAGTGRPDTRDRVAKVSDCSHPSDLACTAKVFDRACLKVLTPKQMLQRLSIALAQMKAGNSSENL